MSLKRDLAKSNIFFTVGRIVSAVIAFFFSFILARLLQPYNFGLYSFALVVVGFFTIFTDLGLNSVVTRFAAEYMSRKDAGRTKSLLITILKYKIIIIMATGGFICLFPEQISSFIFNKPEAGFIVFLSGTILMVNSLFSFLHNVFSGMKNFAFVSVLQISESALKFVIVLTLVVSGMSVEGSLYGLIATYLILVVVSTLVFYRKYGSLIEARKGEIEKSILMKFGAWVLIATVLASLDAIIDQFMISMMLPVEEIGFYRIAYTWMWSAIFVVPIAGQVMYPYFSSAENREQLSSMFFRSVRYSCMFIFPIAFLLSAYSTPLILFLYKESFIKAASPLSILAFASIPITLSMILTTYFNGVKKPEIVTKIISVMIFVNIVLNYLLIGLYGITGASIAILTVKTIETAAMLFLVVRFERMTFRASAIIKPLMASLLMYYASVLFLPLVTNYFTLAFYAILSLALYSIVMLIIGGIDREDISMIRRGIKPIKK